MITSPSVSIDVEFSRHRKDSCNPAIALSSLGLVTPQLLAKSDAEETELIESRPSLPPCVLTWLAEMTMELLPRRLCRRTVADLGEAGRVRAPEHR